MSMSEGISFGRLCKNCFGVLLDNDGKSVEVGYPILCEECAEDEAAKGDAYWTESHGVCIWGDE